jgi:hypothetical protein
MKNDVILIVLIVSIVSIILFTGPLYYKHKQQNHVEGFIPAINQVVRPQLRNIRNSFNGVFNGIKQKTFITGKKIGML